MVPVLDFDFAYLLAYRPAILVRDAAATLAGSLQSTWPQHLYAGFWGCRTVSERQAT